MKYRYYSLCFLILAAMLVIAVGCTPKPAVVNNKVLELSTQVDAPDSVYSQSLEAFNVGNVETSDNQSTFTSADSAISKDLSAQTVIRYTKNSSGNYSGTMVVNLHKSGSGASRYVLNISKSFAQDINQLEFSIKPDKIIQADPVVAWDVNKDDSISIKSSKSYSKDEMTHAFAKQTFSIEYDACEKIESFEESSVCEWRLFERYKDEPFMKDVLGKLPLATPDGAAIRSLLDGNYDMCAKYLSGDQKNRCFQLVFRTREFGCRSSNDQKDCVRKILWPLGLNNIKGLCSFIADPDMKKECEGKIGSGRCDELEDNAERVKCVTNIARASKDVKDCNKLEKTSDQDECKKYLGTDSNNADICRQISDSDLKDECIERVAIQKNDKELCKEVNNENAKNLCQVYLMAKEGKIDRGVCDKMQGDEGWIKDMCLSCYAVSIKDISVCNEVNDSDSVNMCRMTVAVVLNDSSICESFKEDSDKDLCYNMFGLILDKKFCSKIINEEMKKDCLKTPLPEKLNETNTTNENNTTGIQTAGPCPVSPPSTAHKYDQQSETGGWMVRYALASGASVGEELFYYDKAKTKIASSKCYNLNGNLEGPTVIYNKDGTKSSEGNYKDGKNDGVFRQWRSGTLESLNTYKDGKPNGPTEVYITDPGATFGHLSYSGNYLGYKKTGDWKYYNGVTGDLEEEATFDNDCMTNDKTYYEDGSKEFEKTGTCTNGKFTGTTIQYSRPANGKQDKTTCQEENNEIKSCV